MNPCFALQLTSVFFGINYILCDINLRGKGASFPSKVYQKWIASYKRYRSAFVILNMNYDDVGSEGGKTAIKTDKNIEYAASDSLLSLNDSINYPDLVTFPTMAGAVVLAYNIPGFTLQLNLTMGIIVGIYNDTIQYWNDTLIQEINPKFTFPGEQIIVTARKDKSGTTQLFTEALSNYSSAWKSRYGSFSAGINNVTGRHDYWKSGAINYFGDTNSGIAGILMSFDYSIGYLSAADAKGSNIRTAFVKNHDGYFTNASPESVQSAMDYYGKQANSLTFSLHNAAGMTSYPIAGFTYFIAYKTKMANCDSAREFVRYTYWVLTDETQINDCSSLGMAPLSQQMIQNILNNVLKKFQCHGQSVWDMVQADIAKENEKTESWIFPVSVALPLFLFLVLCFCSYIFYQRISFLRKLYNDDWFIPIEDIVFFYDSKVTNSLKSRFFTGKSLFSIKSSSTDMSQCPELIQQVLQWPGKWNGNVIGLRVLKIKQLNKITRNMKGKMLLMKDKINHNNVVRFYGLTDLDNEKYVIGEYCSKGQLTDLLQNDKFNMTNQLKLSLALDVAQGMHYLHSKSVIHGNLKSSNCLIDAKWTVKVCDWEYNGLILCQNELSDSSFEMRKNIPPDESEYAKKYQDFWTAPEIIRVDYKCRPTTACDVYSYSMILQEIYTREDPYSELADEMNPDDVINAVVYTGRLRPKPSEDMPLNVRQCMEIAWSDSPEDRPSFEQMLKMMRVSRMSGKSVLDSMMEAIEEYTVLLEERVEEKASESSMAIQQLQNMLSTYIPMSIVTTLANGQPVGTRQLGTVGIICVDIRNFHKLIASVKKVNNKIKLIENFHQSFESVAEAFSAFTYRLTFDTMTFILGIGSTEKSDNTLAFETANMCLQLETTLKNFIRPKPLEYAISGTIDVLHERILSKNGRYQLIGSSLEKVTLLSRKAKLSNVLISLLLCVKIKAFDCFIVSEVKGIKDRGQSVYRLHGRTDTIPEEIIDVIHLEENRTSEGSVDSGLDVTVTIKPDIFEKCI